MALPKDSCLPLFLLSLSLLAHLSHATDSISANNPLSGSRTIISKEGNFVLGFFQPGNRSSQKHYIAIWYKKVSQPTTIWMANRDTPVSDPTTSEFRISEDGNLNLVLLNQNKTQIWSTNANTTSNHTVAVLLDTGNLVLRDGPDNSSKVVWQSFDHPTDTWLPGAKLALNKVTGEVQRVTSWKNTDDPAPGLYSVEPDPDGSKQYLIQWNRTKNFWYTGTWNGKIFAGLPEMMSQNIYHFEYVTNDRESYFTYSVSDNSIISRSILEVSGQFKQLVWVESAQSWINFWSQPRMQCQVYARCGPFGTCSENKMPFCNCVTGFREKSPSDWALSDLSGGCVRNTPLQCESRSSAGGEKDKFLMMPDMGLSDNSVSLGVVGAGECEVACLNNCSCTAYSNDNGCSVLYGDLLDLQQLSDGSGSTLYLRLAASELPSSEGKKGLAAGLVALVVVAGVVAGGVVLFFVIWLLMRRQKAKPPKVEEGSLIFFQYRDLLRATKNFSEKLGGGGFGSVFKGMLPDSTAIAVKKLEGLRQGEKQFRMEVRTIGTVQHINLVRLRGFCSRGNEKLLVYDYMENSSLDTHLFRDTSMSLDWNKRYQIALGTARGLAYLHEKCRDCIIHCDIKPENILLDASFIPKVSDFGLAKLLGRDFSRVLTTMRGTRGYLAPEWISGVAITAKADVYSYGMTLFEIISGRRNSEHLEIGQAGYFPKLAAVKLIEGDVLALLDHKLVGNANLEEFTRACKVACWCIQDDEISRPSMGQVVQILEGTIDASVPPIPRSLQIFADKAENIVFFTNFSSNRTSQRGSTTSTGSQAKSTSY